MSTEVTTAEPAAQASTRGGRARSVLAGICGVLGVVALTLALMGVWANATVFDSEEVGEIVSVALADPEVTAGLATWVTDEVFTALDVEDVVSEVLPDRLDRLAPTVSSGAQTFVDRRLTQVLDNPEVQATLTQAVERAHEALMRLLSGDGLVDGINVDDGVVTVNFLPLVSRGLSFVQGLGLFSDLDVPELTRDGDPSEQIAQLEEATGRRPPRRLRSADGVRERPSWPRRRRRCRTPNVPSSCSSGRHGSSPCWPWCSSRRLDAARPPALARRLVARPRRRPWRWSCRGPSSIASSTTRRPSCRDRRARRPSPTSSERPRPDCCA